jgi:hypothetical protein
MRGNKRARAGCRRPSAKTLRNLPTSHRRDTNPNTTVALLKKLYGARDHERR